MKKKVRSLLKKTAAIAGVTCIAASAVAVVSSKAALQAMLKGSEYFKNRIGQIVSRDADEA